MKTINGWTKAELIDYIKDSFEGQSVDDSDNCAYRGLWGTRCPVGMFIPDSCYNPEMEGERASKVIILYSLMPYMPLPPIGMEKLQDAHDGSKLFCLQNMIDYIEHNVEG